MANELVEVLDEEASHADVDMVEAVTIPERPAPVTSPQPLELALTSLMKI